MVNIKKFLGSESINLSFTCFSALHRTECLRKYQVACSDTSEGFSRIFISMHLLIMLINDHRVFAVSDHSFISSIWYDRSAIKKNISQMAYSKFEFFLYTLSSFITWFHPGWIQRHSLFIIIIFIHPVTINLFQYLAITIFLVSCLSSTMMNNVEGSADLPSLHSHMQLSMRYTPIIYIEHLCSKNRIGNCIIWIHPECIKLLNTDTRNINFCLSLLLRQFGANIRLFKC